MADSERDLADCVGALYEAATGGGSWLDVGQRLRKMFQAQRATLLIGSHAGAPTSPLMPVDDAEAAYMAHFHAVDPYLARARADFAQAHAHHLGRAKVGAELVPEHTFLKSEFFNDFARLHERRHLLGGMVGIGRPTPMTLFRGNGAAAFGDREVRLLQTLLPHVQSALELRARLGRDRQSIGLTRVALDALPFGVGIVDAGLKIHFANDIACKYLAAPDAGLFSIRSGPHVLSGVYLGAMAREEASTLRRLVASAASGGAGGFMRVSSRAGAMMAMQVSPVPAALAEELAGAAFEPSPRLAMLTLRPLEQKTPPPADMLCELFGFSRAEAEVATALSGGATAAEVARRRGVSLMTVRSQVRSILSKSASENLRDLERSMAALEALVPRAPSAD